jgi:hypothetical protein
MMSDEKAAVVAAVSAAVDLRFAARDGGLYRKPYQTELCVLCG